jgi:hypothetical protein
MFWTIIPVLCLLLQLVALGQTPQSQSSKRQSAGSLTSAPQAPPPSIQLVSPNPAIIQVDKSGNGSASLLFKGKPGLKLSPALLMVTDFSHAASVNSTYPLGTQTTISGVPADVPADGLFSVKVAIAQAWETGSSLAQLRNGESIVCELQVRKDPVPFAVQIEGQNPEAVFDYFNDQVPTVVLVNSDHATYRFKWSLVLPGRDPRGPAEPVTILPNDKISLDLI